VSENNHLVAKDRELAQANEAIRTLLSRMPDSTYALVDKTDECRYLTSAFTARNREVARDKMCVRCTAKTYGAASGFAAKYL
jgi:hypothetical protein